MKPDICIYHAPCQDGFTAAWAVSRRWPDIEFHPGVYGEAPPDVAGKRVLIVDFSYKRDVLLDMSLDAAGIVVVDHHKTAQADLEPYIGLGEPFTVPLTAQFDMTKSGAMLAWEFCHGCAEPPAIIRHVQDRDLWRFELAGTRDICADLFSRTYAFGVWNDFALSLETPTGRTMHLVAGEAIERKHYKDIKELLRLCTREMVIGGHRVKVANIPYTMSSDAANTLAEGAPFGACYYDNAEGKRVFSLRSKDGGVDVSAIASAYGGGGHARASGFTAPAAWEGDDR